MRKPADLHRARVLATPWAGVQVTLIESSRSFARHWHDSFGFGLLEHGAHRSASDAGSVDAHAGDVITHNPGEVHDGRPLGAPARRWRMLELEPAALTAVGVAPRGAAIERPVIGDDRALAGSLLRLFARLDDWLADGRCDALACEESLVEVCARLLGGRGSGSPAQPEARREMSRVRERLADPRLPAPSLDELASLAGLDKFRTLREFRRTYGVPPHAWLQSLRAERARRLIARGTRLVEAAAACGFADQSHLSRVFSRQFGYTPGALRRAAAQ